jgi:heat shock protein HspQ
MPWHLPSPGLAIFGGLAGSSLVSLAHKTYIRAMAANIDRSTYFSPQAGRLIEAPRNSVARFAIGDVVKHKIYDFRGVIFDIDPVFANSEEWYQSIPKEVRPAREQPYYHLFAENEESNYIAYVSQQNLMGDADGGPVEHPNVTQLFDDFEGGRYRLRRGLTH